MTKKQIDKALLEGCGEGDYNKVRLAINFGADVKAKDNYGWTPLHLTCANNALELAKLLIERGADVEAKDNVGWTPLRKARSEEMRDLLKKYMK